MVKSEYSYLIPASGMTDNDTHTSSDTAGGLCDAAQRNPGLPGGGAVGLGIDQGVARPDGSL